MPKNLRLTQDQIDFFMREAIREAEIGMAEGEAPIGCVIVRGVGREARIVSRGHNCANRLQEGTAHAEIMAFRNANAELNGGTPTYPMGADDIALFSTLEPCVMCMGACMESGVAEVYWGLEAPADSGTTRVTPPFSPESNDPKKSGGHLRSECRVAFEDWLEGKEGTEQAKFVEQLLALTANAS